MYYFTPKPLVLLTRQERWRKQAKLAGLSDKAKLRLEWIVFYHTVGKRNAQQTASHFGIARSKFYYWFSRFNECQLQSLEDNPSTPRTKRSWQPDPVVLKRMLSLRKQYPCWGKMKLKFAYQYLFGQSISSWQFQRLIETFQLYRPKKQSKCSGNGAKKQLISKQTRDSATNLFSLDTKVLHLYGFVYYILVAVSHTGKLAYARAYWSHSSATAADFLARLEYLFEGKVAVILTDNGSEFQKHFNEACQKSNINRYYSRVRTPKDNPEVERMIRTLQEEWLNLGNCHKNIQELNQSLTQFLIIYNFKRPHQTLNYLTPIQYALNNGLLSKRSSSSTADWLFVNTNL